ncbi:MAG: phosphatidate cytidylyltransferase [Desulfobacterales bacterium]
MHLKRWMTGIAALPLVIYLIVGGPLHFLLLIAVVALLTYWEYGRIVLTPLNDRTTEAFVVLGLAATAAIPAAVHLDDFGAAGLVVALNLVGCGLLALIRFSRNPGILDAVFRQTAGIVYIPLSLSLLIPLRSEADGWKWILFILFIVFAGDIGAYYVGTYRGRHKLCPAVSPGKTIEGAAGGIAGNLVVGSLFKTVWFAGLPWIPCVMLFCAVGVAGQIGDLFESQIKRTAGIKDSGTLLPGHGGFLDRIDALLFVAPVAYAFRYYILT